MGWNGKNDVIVLILSFSGFALVALLVGVVAPMITDIRDSGIYWIMKIVVLLGLMGCGIYITKRIFNKKERQKE